MRLYVLCTLFASSFLTIDGALVKVAKGVVRNTASAGFALSCSGGQCNVPSVGASVKQFTNNIGNDIYINRCRRGPGPQLDFLIVIDGSGSVPRRDFDAAKQDAKQYAKDLFSVFYGLPRGSARIGLIVFSSPEDIKVYLDFSTYDLGSINEIIDSVTYPGRLTYTTRALERAIVLFREKGRRSANKILLIFTDGKSNGYWGANRHMPKPAVPASTLKNQLGVTIYGWPIGQLTDASLVEIRSIVSSPADNYINYAKDYAEARLIARRGFQAIKNKVGAKGSGCIDGEPIPVRPKPRPRPIPIFGGGHVKGGINGGRGQAILSAKVKA